MSTPRRRRHDPLPPGEGRLDALGPTQVDLHTHTTRSDGIVGPHGLVRAVAAAGVRTLAITDHDTLAGYRDLVADSAVPDGLTLIPGVEINAIVTKDLGLWEGELHILGFGVDPDDEVFEAALAAQRARRRERFDRTLARLRELDLSIDEQIADLSTGDDDALGRPTVARALMAGGHATSVDDAFKRLLGWGNPAYIPRTGLGPVEAIELIRTAGGLPVLAHFSEAPARVQVVQELVEAGLGGLEVYYRSFGAATVLGVGKVADALGLIRTGGTDYHGDLGPYAEAHAELWIPPEVGVALRRTLVGLGSP